MPSFADMGPGGPDTDPTPSDDGSDYVQMEFDFFTNEDAVDQTNYEEPGEGDSFQGQDPSVWATEGNPDAPEAQRSDVPMVETENQTATNPDPELLGEKDAAEGTEQKGDEQEGDSEEDDSDPADVLPEIETPVEIPLITDVAAEVSLKNIDRRLDKALERQEILLDARLNDVLGITDGYYYDRVTNFLEQEMARLDRNLDNRLEYHLDRWEYNTELDYRLMQADIAARMQRESDPSYIEAVRVLEEEFANFDAMMSRIMDGASLEDEDDLFPELDLTVSSFVQEFVDVPGSINADTQLQEFSDIPDMDDATFEKFFNLRTGDEY